MNRHPAPVVLDIAGTTITNIASDVTLANAKIEAAAQSSKTEAAFEKKEAKIIEQAQQQINDCIPIAPNAYSYPELLPGYCLYPKNAIAEQIWNFVFLC